MLIESAPYSLFPFFFAGAFFAGTGVWAGSGAAGCWGSVLSATSASAPYIANE
jgi:hypothetical protein